MIEPNLIGPELTVKDLQILPVSSLFIIAKDNPQLGTIVSLDSCAGKAVACRTTDTEPVCYHFRIRGQFITDDTNTNMKVYAYAG